MIKVIIPNFIKEKDILNSKIISDICEKSFNKTNYIIEYIDRANGRYINLIDGSENHFICLSSSIKETNVSSGRNSFLIQYLSTAYSRYIEEKSDKKKIEIYLLLTNNKAQVPYQKFIYRCAKTLGINVLNSEFIGEKILPFSTYKELKNARSMLSDKNTGNNSSYFSDTGDYIEFFAKCYGANEKESVFLALVVQKLVNKPIHIFQVEDRDSKQLLSSDFNTLKKCGMIFDENIGKNEFRNIDLSASEKDLRDQPAFRLNLFQKYGEKKCYICGCDIDNLIIASHIHRVTDIKNDSTISDDEKRKQIIDGDNGFWLCANHDKLFEYGFIYFDNNKLMISNKLNSQQKDFVKYITFDLPKMTNNFNKNTFVQVAEDGEKYGFNKFIISDKDYNSNMHNYLAKHEERSLK